MSKAAIKKRKTNGEGMTSVLQVPLNSELKEKLNQMSFVDRRRPTEFMRILLEDEWNRREKLRAREEGTLVSS
jgi:hypothetical protein